MNTDNPYMDYNGIYEEYGSAIPVSRRETMSADPADWPNLKRLEDGSLELGSGQIITASALLSALDGSRERDSVSSAMAKLGLSPTRAAHVLAARAYVWATAAPWIFDGPPLSGGSMEAVYEAITLLELARPGTVFRALQGDERSVIYLYAAAQDGLSDAAFLERRSQFADLPITLQSTRTSAQAALELPPISYLRASEARHL